MGARKKRDTMTATIAKNSFGELLDEAKTRPIKIAKNGRVVAVVVSAEDFERFEAFEEAYWGRQAEEALKEGTVGVKKSEALLRKWASESC